MKVLLTNIYSDKNIGDAGIIKSTVDLVKKIRPEASISFLSIFSSKDLNLKEDYLHTGKLGKVYPSFFPFANTDNKFFKLIHFAKYFFINLTIYIFKNIFVAKMLLNSDEYKSFLNFIGSDVLFSKGGQIFYSNKGINGFFFFIRAISILYIATRFNKKIIIYGQSLGPFDNIFIKNIFNFIQKKIYKIYLRENKCIKFLKKKTSNIEVIGDTAFFLKNSQNKKKFLNAKNKLKKKIVLTVRNHFFKDKIKKKNYINSLTLFCNRVISEGYDVFLIQQVMGPSILEDDRIILKMIYKEIINKKYANIIFHKLSPEKIKSIYGEADYLIGMRLHSVIFALGMNVKCICISYHGTKAQGIMNNLGLKKFCIDINKLNSKKIINRFYLLKKNKLNIKKKIKVINKNLINSMQKTLNDI